MFNNVVLDVFIGLIFIFLLYSLLATILQEIIASQFGLRSRMLQRALRRMLEDDNGTNKPNAFAVVNSWGELIFSIARFFKPFTSDNSLLWKFYSHPSIKYLGEGKLFKKPAYLHAHNFSKTIVHLLRGDEFDGRSESESILIKRSLDENRLGINPETLYHLRMMFADARQDSYEFKQKLEEWFEETMQRTSGWYKKQTRILLLWLGFGLAAAFNVDTIAITKILIHDKQAREQTLQLALNRVDDYSGIVDSIRTVTITADSIPTPDTTDDASKKMVVFDTTTTARVRFLDSVRDNLQQDALAIQGILGLRGIINKNNDTASCMALLRYVDPRDTLSPEMKKAMLDTCMKQAKINSAYQKGWFLTLIGWLITALAISLGAPFWFDLLSKIIKLREAGARPMSVTSAGNSPVDNSSKTNAGRDIRG